MPTGFTPHFGQFHVNTLNSKYFTYPDVAALTDGGYVIAYNSFVIGPTESGVYFQRYDSNGDKVGGETAAMSQAGVGEGIPSVIGLSDGGFMIIWDAVSPNNIAYAGVIGQRFDANGEKVGTDFKISTYELGSQFNVDLVELQGGGFIFTWQSDGQDGDSSGVYGQMLDASLNPIGVEFQISTYTAGYQGSAKVTALTDGGFVVSWYSSDQNNGQAGVYTQRFDASGVAVGSETLVNTDPTFSASNPAITALETGGYVITWTSNGGDGSQSGIMAQIYDAAGAAVGANYVVNATTLNNQIEPDITTLADGSFIITWAGWWIDGAEYGVVGQQFSATGELIGPEFRINSYEFGNQQRPSIAALEGGGFVVTWYSNDHSGRNKLQIYAQQFDLGSYSDPIVGTDASEILSDIFGYDHIDGLGGDDLLFGLDGDDRISGGAGNDEIYGGRGDDIIDGGADNDTIFGETGDDLVLGGLGNDYIDGGEGADLLFGQEGDDIIFGGNGADELHGGADNDTINGGAYDDKLWGDAGDDILNGDSGDDLILGGDGQDTIDGGIGDDLIWGERGDDTGRGGLGSDRIHGGAGNDTLFGGDGNDFLWGGEGNDTLYGGTGDDMLKGGSGADIIHGEAGADTLYGGGGDDRISGGYGDDIIKSGKGADVVWGDDGNDQIWGNAGNDTLSGGAGNDSILGGQGDDTLNGDSGDDTLKGGAGNDQLNGGIGNDFLWGGRGNDTLLGGAGNDILHGRGGDDTLIGGAGKDLLIGGHGADVFVFNAVQDSADNNNQFDRIADFETGIDHLNFSAIAAQNGGLAFRYLGDSGFSGTGSGEIRTELAADGNTVMLLDVDGDGVSDMRILFNGTVSFTATDFIY